MNERWARKKGTDFYQIVWQNGHWLADDQLIDNFRFTKMMMEKKRKIKEAINKNEQMDEWKLYCTYKCTSNIFLEFFDLIMTMFISLKFEFPNEHSNQTNQNRGNKRIEIDIQSILNWDWAFDRWHSYTVVYPHQQKQKKTYIPFWFLFSCSFDGNKF